MKIVSYLQNDQQLIPFQRSGVKELIIESHHFARLGRLSVEEMLSLTEKCRALDIKPVLQWDILMSENRLGRIVEQLARLPLEIFHAVRVQDLGALNYLLEKYPEIKIQLILENGNLNLKSIQEFVTVIGNRLDRVILSMQLPGDCITKYIRSLSVPVEILGLGRILLSYTPRKLISNQFSNNREYVEGEFDSCETSHRKLPIIENQHGTFIFHHRDHCLLENVDELEEVGPGYCRVDLRWGNCFSLLDQVISLINKSNNDVIKKLMQDWPREVRKDFYLANKTDLLFDKLINLSIKRNDQYYLGDVLDFKKKEYLAIMLRNHAISLKKNDQIILVTPEGRRRHARVNFIKNSSWKDIEMGEADQLVFINHVNGSSVRTAIYLSP